MIAVTTNLSALVPPSSTRNPRRLKDVNKRLPARVSFPAKPFLSLAIRIAASSPWPPTCTPLAPLFPATRSSTLTGSTRSSALAGSSWPSSATELTRSLATQAALAMAAARALAHKLFFAAHASSPGMGDAIPFSLQTGGPVFIASDLYTPQTVLAVVAKGWLDIYINVLNLRLLLAWFPNLPWGRQPLSAIRDLSDPYLNRFRNIIPPIFDTDLSPHLALAVLGTARSILDVKRR